MHREEHAELKKALEIKCPDEPNFAEIYAVLGQPKKIEEIKADNPQPKNWPKTKSYHCKKLKKNPIACNHLPTGDGQYGYCPLNPYSPVNVDKREKAQAKLKEIGNVQCNEDQESFLHSEALRVYALSSMGLVTDLHAITPIEFLLGYFKQQQEETKTSKAQCEYTGAIMASKTAELLAKMFGGKRK